MMIERRFLWSGLTLAAFIAVMGCHSSTTPPQAVPANSPASAAPVQKPAAPPAAVQAAKAPPKPIHVTPPASFSPEQIPQDGPVAFSLRGNAGDLLVMDVKEVEDLEYESTQPHYMQRPGIAPERSYVISVRMHATDDLTAKTIQEGGGCTDKWIYLLSKTGTYQVVLDPSLGQKRKRKYGAAFALLTKNDPVVDPGIKPDQISVDFGGFGRREQVRVEPPVLAYGCLDDYSPSQLALHNRHLWFSIMQVAGYNKVFQKDRGIARLQAALAAGRTDSVGGLPYASSRDVRFDMWARQEILEGDGWRGLRWIGGYGGNDSDSCGPSDLRYVFEGITNDGRFLIVGRAAISHPAKQKRWAPRGCVSKTEVPKINALLAHDLTAADPASFQPNLNQLDAVVRSLKLKH